MKKKTTSKVTKSEPVGVISQLVTGTEYVTPSKIGKLDISFGNEDMNKVVDKINEIIEKLCQ